MKEIDRIKRDIELFEKNCKKIDDEQLLAMAKRYYKDAKYYVGEKDCFTAFGCINYAHGLIDAYRLWRKKGEV